MIVARRKKPSLCVFAIAGAVFIASPAAFSADPSPADSEFFEKQVRPVLAQNCLKCHGDEKQKGNLRLDSREGALKGGDTGPAIEPGKPAGSLLIEVIQYTGDYKMPPRGKMPPEQIAILTEWVQRGAPWPADNTPAPKNAKAPFDLAARRARHWSLQPLLTNSAPAVKSPAWVQSSIDQYILAKLEEAGIAPAPPADKRTLLRRVTYDLIGLPPTPAEIDAFLADDSPRAWEAVVERLLASPHYGERWARHWLDLARFAETAGHEFDFEMPLAFEYRDYVIRAFNADVPYSQFLVEQVAGDLLPEPRRHPTEQFNESIIGTGFYFLGESTHSPVDVRDDEATRVDNQIDVFAKTFLALTVGCARCHDHKFDAISTKDYYALAGYLQSSRYQTACVDPPAANRAIAANLEQLRGEQMRLVQNMAAEFRKDVLVDLDTVGRGSVPAIDSADEVAIRSPVALTMGLVRDGLTATAPSASEPASGETVFEDFEMPTYGRWTTTGNAFGSGPNRHPLPTYQGEVGARGLGFVNSHSVVDASGRRSATDALTGTLTSPPFTVTQPYIHFLIGGGAHPGKTCLNFRIDGKIERTATGRNANQMQPAMFDVREFAGRVAVLEIVDQETGGWGNIGVDQIVFSSRPVGEPGGSGGKTDRGAWARYLQEVALPQPAEPFHLVARLVVDREAAATPKEFARFRTERLAALKELDRQSHGDPSQFRLFEDFSADDFGGWNVTGEAFGGGPLRPPALVLTAAPHSKPGGAWGAGVAHSGGLAFALQGTLRSQTFEIEKPFILYHVAGRDAQVNLIIDGYQKIRDPIYGGLTVKLNQDEPAWHAQNVSKWVGHRAYIEFLDEGAGYVACDRILFSTTPNPPPAPPHPLHLALLGTSGVDSAEKYLVALWRSFGELDAPGAVLAGQDVQSASTSAIAGHLVRWLLDHDLPGSLAQRCQAAFTAPNARFAPVIEKQRELERQIKYQRKVMAMTDGTGEDEYVFIRGNYRKPGELVPRRFLEALAGADQPRPAAGSGRLELARRMLDAAGPLVARVMVNRVWKQHFGDGIVRTPDDFGNMGQPPTHPELLDHLADEFIRHGWSLKWLHRRLLLSNAYQMSSRPDDPQAETIDPQNKLCHRMPIRRLEAEIIRDALLAVSGRLNDTMYGRSVAPYISPFMEGRGRPASGPLDGDGRRSIYINVRRNFLTPLFLAFDYPTPFTTIGRRSVSNVPAQALAMLNNPFVNQQAELWARRVAAAHANPADRITAMYVSAFGRRPDAGELQAALGFVGANAAQAGEGEKQWSALAHVLFNVKEFIFIN